MAEIAVAETVLPDGWSFEVTVSDRGSRTSHAVTMKKKSFEKLVQGRSCQPSHLVRRSFEFLLERESKESILSRFDITLIGHYFPEYEKTIVQRL